MSIAFRVTRRVFMNSVRDVSSRKERTRVNKRHLKPLFVRAGVPMAGKAWDQAQRAFWSTGGAVPARVRAAAKVVERFAK